MATNRDTLYRRSTLRLTLLTDRPAIGGCGLIPSPAAPRNTRKCFFFILFNGRSLFEPFSLAVPLHKGCKNSPLVRSMMIAWPSYLYPNGLYIFVQRYHSSVRPAALSVSLSVFFPNTFVFSVSIYSGGGGGGVSRSGFCYGDVVIRFALHI